MIAELVLGIDQGTSSTKAVVLDTAGDELAHFSIAVTPPEETGRSVLQNVQSIRDSIHEIHRRATDWVNERKRRFRAIGIACQRSGVTAWSAETGESVHPLITWADTSTFRLIENLGTTAIKIADKTGIPTIPNFAAGKIAELQKKYPWPGEKIATLDAFLLYEISGRQSFATEDTMAARTMLYDLRTGQWSDELCRHFSVDIRRLPQIKASVDDFGMLEGVPLKVLIGDQQAALLGRSASQRVPLLNLGTIASLSIPTGDTPVFKPTLMSSVLFSRKTVSPKPGHDRAFAYLSELTSPITGSLLKAVIEEKKLATDLPDLSERCDQSFRMGRKIVMYSNLGRAHEPAWPKGTPEVLISTAENTADDLARAHVENVGNHLIKMIDQFEEYQLCFQGGGREIMVAGGGSECRYLLQYVADCSDVTILLLPSREATARGAALATLIRDDEGKDIGAMNNLADVVRFAPADGSRRQKYLKWRRLEQDVLAGRVPPIATVTLPK